MYDVRLSHQAQKDAVKIERSGLKPKTAEIIRTVRKKPYAETQGFEKLKGDLQGSYSRRINRQHRFVYEILPNANGAPFDGIVKVLSMWTHYE